MTIMELRFKEFLLQLEQNTVGTHNDGNSGNFGNPLGGGAYLDSQQTGSEMKSLSGTGGDNMGTSLHSLELGLPMKQDKDVPVLSINYRDLTVHLGSGFGHFRLKTRHQWEQRIRGNIPESVRRSVRTVETPGLKADVEWYAHKDDNNPEQKHITAVWVR